jgi:peptidoglycan/LPS O-acetylase OafA/YrhL
VSVSLPYRAEIDGLRAIAVVSVVLFHAKVGPFTGGYVGVDIFFVISGFLITSILVKDLASATFSFAGFYERRIRRIFPALFTVVLAAAVAGWFILTPQDYKQFGLSMGYMGVFLSNVYFKRNAGYFGPAAETQPLLHTWSLAVEEQFYTIAPLALLLLYRFAWKARAAVFIALSIASLAFAAYGVSQEWPSAFYFLQSRAWELMLGMLLALGIIPNVTSRSIANGLGMFGLAIIAWAVMAYTPETPFPGVAALLPCVGAALVIHSTSAATTWTQRLLSLPPAVFFGKISYSLYLWHWPLLAFAAYEWGAELHTTGRVGLIAIAVLLATLTWAFIESPARRMPGGPRQRRAFAAGATAIAICVAAGFAIKKTDGIVSRLPPELQLLTRQAATEPSSSEPCSSDHTSGQQPEDGCILGDKSRSTATFVLWGDSHADVIANELSNVAKAAGLKGLLIATGGCPPLLGLENLSRLTFGKCIDANAAIREVLQRPEIRDFIIDARWAVYSEGKGPGGTVSVRARRFVDADDAANRAAFAALLRDTVKAITATGRSVTLIGPVPELKFNLPTTIIKDRMHGRSGAYALQRAEFDSRQVFVMQTLADLEPLPNVRVLYPDKSLCDRNFCNTVENGTILYKDDNHLNPQGVKKLGVLLRDALSLVAP